jgi:two-component system, OmpR family, response regulator
MKSRPNIFVVEDDAEIRALLSDYLQREGFRVAVADGGGAFDRLIVQRGEPDLVVLDLMMPGEDGISICRRLRATSRLPIIMLTARGDDIDRIVGLEVGADDYVPKPFNPRELVARIRAVLRRAGEPAPRGEARDKFAVGHLHVDLTARTVLDQSGMPIDLTSSEFALLACFVDRPNRVLSRDQLMDWTRGRQADAFDRTIDVQVSRLRKKIAAAGPGEPIIKTVRNEGYILTVAVKPVGAD